MSYFDALDKDKQKNLINQEQLEKDQIKAEIISISEPSFVLVRSNNIGTRIFTDILPTYNERLVRVIVSSFEALSNFILNSKHFFICLFSFLFRIINSVVYQSYLVAATTYDQVLSLPDRYSKSKLKFVHLIETLTDLDHRSLWWLEVKITVRTNVKKLLNIVNLTFDIIKRLYLSIFVFSVLGFLAFSVAMTSSSVENNILSKAVDSNSVIDIEKLEISSSISNDVKSILTDTSFNLENEPYIPAIKNHIIKKGETIETVATLYDLKTETIIFNNNITDNKLPKVGENIYLPWADGYIYHANSDVNLSDLARIYHTEEQKIAVLNQSTLDKSNNTFKQDSLVLIPFEDYNLAIQYNQEEVNRIKQQEVEENRKRALFLSSKQIVCSVSASSKVDAGFIWPTTGRITQCYHNGHKAFDISDHTLPVISSVSKGTVIMAQGGWNGGYGNIVKIDHGNGYITVYAHLSEISVSVGDTVSQGQKIGKMGNTGNSTGPHLHFEIFYRGQLQNPFIYMP